jgi:4-hydroxybenzoyl-CoA thioesterase
MTRTHQTTLEIGFRHCDPAGIVFYPRYVEMLNDVVEHWFKHALGCDFATLHGSRGIAIPIVKLAVDFKAPAMLGDTLSADLVVDRLGRSSLLLCITLRDDKTAGAGGIKLAGYLTLVFVRMDGKRPIEIPDDLRVAAACYQRSDAP